jgi:intracellular multiplication protein IcmO
MNFDKFLVADELEIKEKFVAAQKSQEQGIYDAGNSAQAWNSIITNLKSDYGRVFNTQNPTISMYEAVQKNKFIFVTLPTMSSDTTPRELVRLILGLLKGVAAEKAEKSVEPDIPFVCWFDEIGSYIIEGFGRLMSKSRALGISIIPIFQSPAQIDQVGKVVGSESLERREIIDVVGTHILMKNIHPETTEFYAKMLKEKRYIDRDFVEKRDGIKGGIGAEAHYKVEKEQAIKHEEVIAMNEGEMMVFNDGKMYKSIAITEKSLIDYGKKVIYEGKNMNKKLPLTQYVQKERFLKDMTQIYYELEQLKEIV